MPVVFALLLLFGAACSGDDGEDISCEEDELYDPHEEVCVPRESSESNESNDAPDGGDEDADAGDENPTDADDGGGGEPDAEPDVAPEPDADDAGDVEDDVIDPECDKDDDGALAEECGGNDCDDNDPFRAPDLPEVCDGVDNDCSGEANNGIECTFYAHSGQTLYKVDPFEKTAEDVEMETELPNLQDIDTHPDGTLFGVTFDGLYRFDEWGDDWVKQGEFGIEVEDPNGLAIDSNGDAFVTAQDKLYEVDLETGQATLVGNAGGDFYSSGDCVINKGDTLFMTSKHREDEDVLVEMSRSDAEGESVGGTGYKNIFGLTAAWGDLYGVTSAGELIKIDERDGEATEVHTFDDITFYGAASTPER
ncbi:MAG: MopE-related protein [Persicimonas sp.]